MSSRRNKDQELYDEVRTLMSETHLAVTEICRETGWGRTAYYDLLNGDSDPGVKRVTRLCKYLKEHEGK